MTLVTFNSLVFVRLLLLFFSNSSQTITKVIVDSRNLAYSPMLLVSLDNACLHNAVPAPANSVLICDAITCSVIKLRLIAGDEENSKFSGHRKKRDVSRSYRR